MNEYITKYPKIPRVGHRNAKGLLPGRVVVQEKVDGSNIQFGVFDGELVICSRNQTIDQDDPGMFAKAVESLQGRKDALTPGFVYRGEYLQSKRHNVIEYGSLPAGHIVLFEVKPRPHAPYFTPCESAAQLGFDIAPVLFEGYVGSAEELDQYLEGESFLGGMKEGIVVKSLTDEDLRAKMVVDEFKEKMNAKQSKPRAATEREQVQVLSEEYATPARWMKAIQRLREQGQLANSPKDIGPIIKTIQADVMEEEGDEIREAVFDLFRKQVMNGIISGFPQWYQKFLAEEQ